MWMNLMLEPRACSWWTQGIFHAIKICAALNVGIHKKYTVYAQHKIPNKRFDISINKELNFAKAQGMKTHA